MADPKRPTGTTGPVPRGMMGEAGPSVSPGKDSALFGTATLLPAHPVEVRSAQTFTLVYKVGRLGLDDTGSLCVCFRMMSDVGHPQTANPSAPNYVTAICTGSGKIDLHFDSEGGQRPWTKRLHACLRGGYLKEGDEICITFGDTSQGSPGMIMQTFAEAGFEFRLLVDVVATGHHVPLDQQLWVQVVAGPPARWRAVLPTLRRPGETFRLGIKAEDAWGNPTIKARGKLRLQPSRPIAGLPVVVSFDGTERALCIDGLSVEGEGIVWVDLFDGEDAVARAGPLHVRNGAVSGYWGDLHGQSGETVGVGGARDYFLFARDMAFLDVTSHQGNDFQINADFWRHLNELTAELDDPGRFIVFPGYEWSGNTAVGGDHNVFFRHEGRPIRRSSHALLADRTDIDNDALTLKDLYVALKDEDCVLYAHVGGRYADIAYAHDPRLETALELHSAWGTFEWMLTDSFKLGYRCGVVCNSDGHKGRPGASYPGAATFGAYGGLTCFLTDRLDRAAIFEAMRRRHHYGTTGSRIHLDLRLTVSKPGTLFERNPQAFPDTPRRQACEAMMGDILQTREATATLALEISAGAPIERVEIYNAEQLLETVRPYGVNELGRRIRVIWSGAEYRGRGRNTLWRGRARFRGANILRFQKINAWNPERLFEQRGSDTILWDAITTGNFMGFDVWLDADGGEFEVATNHGKLCAGLEAVDLEGLVHEAGGLSRRLRAYRLPETNPHLGMSISRQVSLDRKGDNPIWVCVTTEDGHQAWSSPVFAVHE